MSRVGWVSPGLLLALAAVALPVIVHYLTRARSRTIRYPTLHFLVEAGSGRQALHRLRVFIVLALRCVAVAALVMLFARPFLRPRGAATEPGSARRVVLVVDASLSMRAVQGGVPLFAKARAEAANVLREMEPGTEAGVVFVGASPRAALPALSQNLAALDDALRRAEPTLEAGDPASALALAQRMLGGAGSITVFSDFQRTNWAAVDFRALKGLNCFLRPVCSEGAPNVAVTAVELAPAEPTAGEAVELKATVLNCSTAQRQEVVRLDLPGITQEASVALPPFSSREAVFTFSLPAPGCFPGKVSCRADDLPDDNARYFAAGVREALKVLVVSDADMGDRQSAAFFAATALAPEKGTFYFSGAEKLNVPFSGRGLTVVRRHSQDADRQALETANAFVVVAPAQLAGECAETIGRRVADGALLLCWLDGPTAPGLLGALTGGSAGAFSAPFRLLRPVASGQGDGEPFGTARVARGPLAIFGDPAQGDLLGLRTRRHFLTEIPEGRADEVLLSFEDGSAALALSPAGRGAAVWANFPLAPDGGNVVGSPLFPALLHELLRALRRGEEKHQATPGHAWHLDVPAAQERECRVVGPDRRERKAEVVARGRLVRLALPPADAPGHYRVLQGDALAAVGVVNVDPRESDTRVLPGEALRDPAAVAEGGSLAVLDTEGRLMQAGKPLGLWPWLAAVAVGALAAEMLLLALWRRAPRRPALEQDWRSHRQDACATGVR